MKTIKLITVALLLFLSPLAAQAQYFEMTTNSCPNPSLTIGGIAGDIVVSINPSNGTGSNSVMQYSTCGIWVGNSADTLFPGQSKSVPLQPNTTYGILVMCQSDCSVGLEPTTTTNSPPAINPSFTVSGQGQPASKVTITLMDNTCMKAKTPVKPALQSIKQLSKINFTNKYKAVLTKFKRLP